MKSTKIPSNRHHPLGDVALEKKRMKKALKFGITRVLHLLEVKKERKDLITRVFFS